MSENSEIRLQKFLASAGVASRRKSEELILQGRVEINGRVVTELGTKVLPGDIVKLDGNIVSEEERKVYIMLNKPAGYVTTARDQFGRKTVLDLIEGVPERIFPVGRLDYDTSGLLLVTNDGDLANRLMHPSHEKKKLYRARVLGIINDKKLSSLREGVLIDGVRTSPAVVKLLEAANGRSLIEIEIHEGRNRQVRKMCESVGHPVISLKRVAVGQLSLGDLEEGKWRFLTPKEVEELRD